MKIRGFTNIPLSFPQEWFQVLRRRMTAKTPEYHDGVQDDDTRAYKNDHRWGDWHYVPWPDETYLVRLELNSDEGCYHALDIVVADRDNKVIFRRNILNSEKLPREPGQVAKFTVSSLVGKRWGFNVQVSEAE